MGERLYPLRLGTGWHIECGRCGDLLPAGVPVVPEARWDPGVAALLEAGRERLAAGARDDPFAVEPLYLRASSAELQWRGRGES